MIGQALVMEIVKTLHDTDGFTSPGLPSRDAMTVYTEPESFLASDAIDQVPAAATVYLQSYELSSDRQAGCLSEMGTLAIMCSYRGIDALDIRSGPTDQGALAGHVYRIVSALHRRTHTTGWPNGAHLGITASITTNLGSVENGGLEYQAEIKIDYRGSINESQI